MISYETETEDPTYENYVAEELSVDVAPDEALDGMKKLNHQVNVVQILEILPHTNADNLEIIRIGGYQCVVRKGSFNVGDYGVYIQPDSIVPQTEPFRFIWEPYMCDPKTVLHNSLDGQDPNMHEYVVPVRRRRITVRKFRKEWSEGLLLSLKDFPEHFYRGGTFRASTDPNRVCWKYFENQQPVDVGDDVSDMLGITHYEPEEKGTGSYEYAPKRKRRLPKTFRGWLNYIFRFRWLWAAKRRMCGESTEVGVNAPRYDVEAFKNHADAFEAGELVDVTEKIHGSNSRYMFLDGHMFAGSHNLWKAPESKCIWRKVLEVQPWITRWCTLHEGYAIYGEVTPTQSGFEYGSPEPQFFAFDIFSPDGKWTKPWRFVDIPAEGANSVEYQGIVSIVPFIATVPFDADLVKAMADGKTETDGDHIREGIVVNAVDPERTAHGVGRLQLKIVSNAYYEKESKSTI